MQEGQEKESPANKPNAGREGVILDRCDVRIGGTREGVEPELTEVKGVEVKVGGRLFCQVGSSTSGRLCRGCCSTSISTGISASSTVGMLPAPVGTRESSAGLTPMESFRWVSKLLGVVRNAVFGFDWGVTLGSRRCDVLWITVVVVAVVTAVVVAVVTTVVGAVVTAVVVVVVARLLEQVSLECLV